jgi:hypothetical protein
MSCTFTSDPHAGLNPDNLVCTPIRYTGAETDDVFCILDRSSSTKSDNNNYIFSFLHGPISDVPDYIVSTADQSKGVKRDQTGFSQRCMFKTRQTFLNDAPTSTKSALRLLNAPSVSFWYF